MVLLFPLDTTINYKKPLDPWSPSCDPKSSQGPMKDGRTGKEPKTLMMSLGHWNNQLWSCLISSFYFPHDLNQLSSNFFVTWSRKHSKWERSQNVNKNPIHYLTAFGHTTWKINTVIIPLYLSKNLRLVKDGRLWIPNQCSHLKSNFQ